jgi:hypothetical protein
MRQSVRKSADRSHCRFRYEHINHLYKIPSIVGGILQSREIEHTFVLSIFRYLLYSVLRYFSFFFIHPVYSAQCDCLVCRVVKPAVCV